MPVPDFLDSRRQLRRSRLLDALLMPREGLNVRTHRDRLLERLAVFADSPTDSFDSISENIVDTVVSLALTEIEESATDALAVVLLCIRVLVADGQFAKLRILANRITALSRRLSLQRPYLSNAVNAFALSLRSEEHQALALLQEVIGPDGFNVEQLDVGDEVELLDLLLAASLRSMLLDGNPDIAYRARFVAIRAQAGFALAYFDAIISWFEATNMARPELVLGVADPIFRSPQLLNYLEQRRIGVLFPAQIKAIQGGVTLDSDCVISLPTSSGKTLVAEFRIAASLSRKPGAKAIYVAPYRLIARQVERSFSNGLRPLGISVRDIGNSYDPSAGIGADEVFPDVSICTPERLDSLLRLSSQDTSAGSRAADLFRNTSVLVFDELQMIGRSGRGPRFELILTRLRMKYSHIRFLGLAAAGQGIQDLARWLTQTDAIVGASRPTGTLEIVWEVNGELKQRVEPRPTKVGDMPRSDPKSDAAQLIHRLLQRYSPVLAVETSRSSAEALAAKVVEVDGAAGAVWRESLTTTQNTMLNEAIEEVCSEIGEHHLLARFMEFGIAFHHAGLPTRVLQRLEVLASNDLLRVVSATTTVAEGADLPFRAVVIPHLNFPGDTRKLERELYLNIIGRAGRANVSVEGLVFILDSDASTLRDLVKKTLWSQTYDDRVQGRLGQIGYSTTDSKRWNEFNDAQSQILGWLGDGNSYVDDQISEFLTKTFSWTQGTTHDRQGMSELMVQALSDLEVRGFARAASPYQLTSRGWSARLTGLSAPSVMRIERVIERGRRGWLSDLVGVNSISPTTADLIARLLFEGIEVAEKSLWLRKNFANGFGEVSALLKLANGEEEFVKATDEYEADIRLMTSWILGQSYMDIARVAPVYQKKRSLFGGTDESKRISDVTEYIGRLTYPAGWVWSSVRILAGELGESLPVFIRNAIELGLPSEASTRLCRDIGMTRGAALAIAKIAGPQWTSLIEWLAGDVDEQVRALGLTKLDYEKFVEFKFDVAQ